MVQLVSDFVAGKHRATPAGRKRVSGGDHAREPLQTRASGSAGFALTLGADAGVIAPRMPGGIVVWSVIALALAFDFVNGLHDAANSIATIVSTRVMKP